VTDTPQHITHPVAFQRCSDGTVKLSTTDQGSHRHLRDLTAEELADAATLAQRTVRLAAGPAS
jgi:hypothetical protein